MSAATITTSVRGHSHEIQNPTMMFTRGAPQQIGQSVTIHVPDASRAAPAAIGPTVTDQLRQLAELRTAGHLTDEEFVAQKQRLLRS